MSLSRAGSVTVGEWQPHGGQVRSFDGTERVVDTADAPVHIAIVGCQHVDGRIWRRVLVGGDLAVTASEARQLARMLIAAGDEIDWLSDSDWATQPWVPQP